MQPGEAQPDSAGGRVGNGGRGGGGSGPRASDPAAPSFLASAGAALQDEYDPAQPNDYAAIRRAREVSTENISHALACLEG